MVRLICANYQIGQAESSTPWHFHGLFTCCMSYRTGQTESSTLWHFDGLLDCETPNRSDGLFYSLTLDGSTIRNQLGLGGNHRYGMYTTKVSADVWSTRLVGLICRHHSNSCFKAIGGRGPVSMMMMRLTRIVWCQCNEVDRRRAHSGGEEDWGL